MLGYLGLLSIVNTIVLAAVCGIVLKEGAIPAGVAFGVWAIASLVGLTFTVMLDPN